MDYSFIKENNLETIDSIKVSDSIISKYKNIIPDDLLSFWKKDGFAGYSNGLIWTVNPESIKSYLEKWVNSDKYDADYKPIPIMRTAFCDIIFFSKNDYKGIGGCNIDIVDVRHQEILQTPSTNFSDFFNDEIKNGRIVADLNIYSYIDVLLEHGPINKDQCYAYEPILALGGEEKVENIRIVNYANHLDILTQALDKQLILE